MDNEILELGGRLGNAILARKKTNDDKFQTPAGSNTLKALANAHDRAMLEYQQALITVLTSAGSLLKLQSERIDILVDKHAEWTKHIIGLPRTELDDVFAALHQGQAGQIRTDMLFGDLEQELIKLTVKISLVTTIETIDSINDVRIKQLKAGLIKLLTDKFLTVIPGTGFVMSLIRLGESTILAPDKAASGAQDYVTYFEQSIAKLNALSVLLRNAANLLASRVDATELFVSSSSQSAASLPRRQVP